MEKYREIGIKLTPQRLAILDYLDGNTRHPSAEDIYRAVSRRFPTMSLATVYSTLAALKKRGRLLELTIDPAKKRYDPETGVHSHLICVSCKRIIDVPDEQGVHLPQEARQDFSIIKGHTEYYGICPSCKTNTKNTAPIKEEYHVRRP